MGTVADDFEPGVAPSAAVDPLAESNGELDEQAGAWPPVPPGSRGATAEAPAPLEPSPSRGRRSRSVRAARSRRAATVPVVRAPAPSTARHYRQTIRKVDLWSVLKISICFYICAMAVTMIALVSLWVLADAAGVITSIEKFFGDLLQTKDFTFLDQEILRGALLIAAVLVVLEVVITVIAAAFYNLFAELFGGIEITISEDETTL